MGSLYLFTVNEEKIDFLFKVFPLEFNDSKTKALFECIGEGIPTRVKIQTDGMYEPHN
jgi:hypothetical protein